MPEIVSIGECMVEFCADEPLESASTLYRYFGGDALNVLAAASRLGSSTGFITRVGQDPFAHYLLDSWQREGIDVSQAKVVPGFNGLYFISLLEQGQYQFTYYRKGSAASTLSPADLDRAYIASARVLHFSGITQAISASARRTALEAARIAHESGVLVSFDPNFRERLWTPGRAKRALQEVLPLVDVVLPSVPSETGILLGAKSAPEAIRRLWDMGASIVAVKEGPKGCTVGVDGEIVPLKAEATKVVDTTGAGDAFNGGFLHGLAAGHNAVKAARLGLITAALKVRGRGGVRSLPTGEEVYELFKKVEE